jgi:hypothetical protein
MVELTEGENLIKVIHRHWFVLVSISVTLLFLAIVPIIGYIFLVFGTFSIFPPILRELLVSKVYWGAFAYSLWVALLWIIFFMEWTNYYLDTWIITDERLISINQKGFFNREIITVRYSQIQDVTVVIRGIIPSFLKFGHIQVESAGEFRKIMIRQVDDPERVKALIMEMQSRA